MSAIGGILNFNGRPLDTLDLLSLWELLKDRGPDGGSFARDGLNGGVCYNAFHINSQSRSETQPYIARDGRMMVADARLDNRDELIVELREILDRKDANVTDVELAMAAHKQWGNTFPLHLVGEFALVLIDPANRTWLLARDHIGARPLYYYSDRDKFICSSSIVSLLHYDSTPRRINEEYVADFIAYIPEPGLTAFKDIHSVKPGCTLTVTADGRIDQTRYWNLDPNKKICFQRDEEYEEAFVDLFSDAVRAALRSDRPVMADLSGGLDSSSVVCMADRLLTRGQAEAPDLQTISLVYDESRTCDERKYIAYVEDHTGRQSNHLREDDYQILSPDAVAPSIGGPNFFYPFSQYHRAKRRTMDSVGARVALCGRGGDQILNSNPDPSPELADLFKLGRPLQLHRRLGTWSESLNKPYVSLVWQSLIYPALPLNLQVKCKPSHRSVPAPWIDSHFARRMNLQERRRAPRDEFGFRLPSERDQASGFLSVMRGIAVSHDYGLENVWTSYPYLHRPLVEFMQAIPFSQKVRPGETRSLLRRSLRDVLPPQTLARKGKKSPTEALLRAINREASRLRSILTRPLVCSHGFASAGPLLDALERAKLGHDLAAIDVVNIVCLELWLRALENDRSTPGSNKEMLARAATNGLGQNSSIAVSQTLSNNALRDHVR
jgi:asparagine synthase (glutamine-hydrolysing)